MAHGANTALLMPFSVVKDNLSGPHNNYCVVKAGLILINAKLIGPYSKYCVVKTNLSGQYSNYCILKDLATKISALYMYLAEGSCSKPFEYGLKVQGRTGIINIPNIFHNPE